MNYLDNVSDDNAFNLDGRRIHSLRDLLAELKSMGDDLFGKHVNGKNDFYNWITHVIKDQKLAQRIRNLTLKKNFIKVLSSRIEFLEKLELGIDTDKINISLHTHDQHIIFSVERDKCILCDICENVCPQSSITVNSSIKVKDSSQKLNKCVLCGFCVPFCPTDALNITVNGENKNPMSRTEALPIFMDSIKINRVKVKQIFDGIISVDNEKCPETCEDCVSACPTFAIKRDGKVLTINEKNCFYCGACVKACSSDCINLKRSRLIYKSGFCSNLNDTMEKLIGPHIINVEHDNSSMRKISKLIKSNKVFSEYGVQANIKRQIPELNEEAKN